MKIPKISLFASAVRQNLFQAFLDSLKNTTVQLEVVFAGNCYLDITHKPGTVIHPNPDETANSNVIFKYVVTNNIKPAQCYEIARRHCTGELIHWTADDCEYSEDFLARAYDYWRSQNNRKLILSLQTQENYGHVYHTDMNLHRFFGGKSSTPLMAPLGLMHREYLEELGGYDRRYICGQSENDIVMRIIQDGGKCEIFGDKENFIEIDHIKKHGDRHYDRPFAKGYTIDRNVLEASWTSKMKIVDVRNDEVEPFESKDIFTKSQSNNLELWV